MFEISAARGFYRVVEESTDGDDSEDLDLDHETITVDPFEFDEDTYGMLLVSLVRDWYKIEKGEPTMRIRSVRFSFVLLLVLFNMFAQTLLLVWIKKYVSFQAVFEIRESYSLYEETIYGKENCTWTIHNSCRGKFSFAEFPGVELARARLNTLPDDDIDNICRIPLSQPYFFATILLIWAFLCMAEMRMCSIMWYHIVYDTKSDGIRVAEDADDEMTLKIVSLNLQVKTGATIILFLRILLTCLLWWLGSRWLLATNSFGDLVLNASALEFILKLKELLYKALTPNRNRDCMRHTIIETKTKALRMKNDPQSICHLCETLWYFAVSFTCVVSYVWGWQDVLPNYKWDVEEVCCKYIEERFSV